MNIEDNSSGIAFSAPPSELDLSGIEQAALKAIPEPKDIDVTFFSNKTRKSTKLIGNRDKNNVIKARESG